MDEIKIEWTEIALKQRKKIFDYWNSRNKSNNFSRKLNQIVYEKIDLLKQNPYSRIEIENEFYRILHFGNYSLVYKPELPIIYIMAFWDNRQNPNKLRKILGL